MNKKFLQSVAAGITGLTLIASCSHLGLNKESNVCGAKNGCAAKKSESHKCASKKAEAHKCAAKKAEAVTTEVAKEKKHHKKAAKVEAVKTEEKKN
jgi:hypothetical protein